MKLSNVRNGSNLNPLGVQGYYNNTLFVSPNGNDLTATVGRISLPYQSIEVARDVVRDLVKTTGAYYTIYVFAGDYTIKTPLNSPRTSYYFQPLAIVRHDDCWVLNDADIIFDYADNTKILGYGTFIQTYQGTFGLGFSSSSIDTTNWEIEFEQIAGDCGVNFTGTKGKQYINGKYLRNRLQYVLVAFNTCLWNVKIREVQNRTGGIVSEGDTGAGSFIYVQLEPPNKEPNAVSFLEVDALYSNANDSFETIEVLGCSPNYKVMVKANIFHSTGSAKPTFMGTALGVMFGGVLEFEGSIKSNGGIAKIYGGDNSVSSILINDSICEHTLLSNDTFRPAIKVNNSEHWITIKDSIITTSNPICCSVGVLEGFGDTQNGNLQLVNTVIQNISQLYLPPIPSANILTGKVLGEILLDDVTLIDKNSTPSYSIGSDGTPQTVSVLSGGVTATNDVEPLLISNTIVGTNIILAPQTLTNPYIK